jgi:hypothetical protein
MARIAAKSCQTQTHKYYKVMLTLMLNDKSNSNIK